jgi:hypothetical protein
MTTVTTEVMRETARALPLTTASVSFDQKDIVVPNVVCDLKFEFKLTIFGFVLFVSHTYTQSKITGTN